MGNIAMCLLGIKACTPIHRAVELPLLHVIALMFPVILHVTDTVTMIMTD